jgi:transposase
MSLSPLLDREEIRAVYAAGPEAVIALVEGLLTQLSRVGELEARLKELEDRLSRDSHNSSQPPSSDPAFTKGMKGKPAQSLRQKSGKPPGGQRGHRGETLRLREDPHQVVIHSPSDCAHCGGALSGGETVATERRQVWEVPPMSVEVTEHRAEHRRCPGCGGVTSGVFPAGVTRPVQYGERLRGVAVYLQAYHLLPFARTSELLGDLFGVPLSEGTLFRALHAASERLETTEGAIKAALRAAAVVHFDETGLRVEGKLAWLHSAGTETLVHYAVHPKRGQAATKEIGVLPGFGGRAVHDGWSSYFAYGCAHALCNAHHLRELTFLHERHGQAWAEELKALLREMKQAVEAARSQGRTALEAGTIQALGSRYDRLLEAGEGANPPPPPSGEGGEKKRGRKRQTKARNLLDRLRRYRAETLAFLHDFAVPFDNNLAERDLRMMKVRQKISGGFRAKAGADAFCRIRTYLTSARKQGHNVFAALVAVFQGHPLSLVTLAE